MSTTVYTNNDDLEEDTSYDEEESSNTLTLENNSDDDDDDQSSSMTASLQIMITRKMRGQLEALGYQTEEVTQIHPFLLLLLNPIFFPLMMI